jgi:hypothetical protein
LRPTESLANATDSCAGTPVSKERVKLAIVDWYPSKRRRAPFSGSAGRIDFEEISPRAETA